MTIVIENIKVKNLTKSSIGKRFEGKLPDTNSKTP